MRQMIKRVCASALLICMITAMLMVPTVTKVEAATAGQRYNIMLVIDGSGSLVDSKTKPGSDPKKLRYELIGDLLGVLEDEGHYVGAVVFSGNKNSKTSKEAMESGIRCNTGMVLLDGTRSKESIYNEIVRAGVDKSYDGKTDVGTALLVAERVLTEKQKENGLPSLIFLFTDGNTDVEGEVKKQSDKNRETAIQEIRENDIRLFGAFLNKDGLLSSDPMVDIVCDANNISSNSEEFSKSYHELTDADSCHQAVNTFLKFLGYIDDTNEDDPITGSIEDEFLIPGIGVEEMNIRLYSYKGEDLPEDMKVELTQPDGTVISESKMNSMLNGSDTYRIYKLVKPMSGTWKLKVTVPENNEILYVYSRVFSKHVDAQLTITPGAANLHVNANADFTASLVQNGTAVTDQKAYSGYECSLEIKNLADNTVETFEIPNNSAKFVYNMDLKEYGSYAARVVFKCETFVVASEYVAYDLYNNAPSVKSPAYLDLKSGLFQQTETEIDLEDYIDDLEDGKELQVTLLSATCDEDALDLDEDHRSLTLENNLVGDGEIVILVTDSQGESVELRLEVETTNVTLQYILYILLAILVLFILFVLKKRGDSNIKLDGDLNAVFELKIDDEKKNFDLLLPLPGRDAPGKTTLKALMQKCLEDDAERHQGVRAEKIKEALEELNSELDKVMLSKTVVRVKGERVGGVIVKAGKKQDTMPGKRSVEISAGGLDISLIYARAELDTDMFDDAWDFDAPDRGKKDKKSKKRPNRDISDFDEF